MSNEIDYRNNPLHGVSLKNLLIELVDHYGFEILFAYLSVNCFKTNPSIDSSVKFLKKMDWAREKVEAFYLYEYKNLPRASSEQFLLSPRDRAIPQDQQPGEPAELDLQDAERLREKRARKSEAHGSNLNRSPDQRRGYSSRGERSPARKRKVDSEAPNSIDAGVVDPWAKSRNKLTP